MDKSEIIKEAMSELGKRSAAKRWAGHEKQTEEEKRKKWNEYLREYRARKKKENK